MTQEFVLTIVQEAMKLLLFEIMPVLGVALAVGLIVSLFQAATQLQEMTLTFIPKIVAVFLTLMFLSPWMLRLMLDFTRQILVGIPGYVR
ncbi:MAG: flagellar biosynthesis protein FliQ [Deltaproteobacteria bacterium]|nr:flagellar biosynthesis protein FliQ [Deltaproteobacteria bacterium]